MPCGGMVPVQAVMRRRHLCREDPLANPKPLGTFLLARDGAGLWTVCLRQLQRHGRQQPGRMWQDFVLARPWCDKLISAPSRCSKRLVSARVGATAGSTA